VLVPDDSFAGIPDAGIRPWKDEQVTLESFQVQMKIA